MADYLVTDTELTSIANAIRTKGGTTADLEFPQEFVQAINDIQTGGSDELKEFIATLKTLGSNPLNGVELPEMTNFKQLTQVGSSFLGSVTGLKVLVLPSIRTIGQYGFADQKTVEIIDMGTATPNIGTWFFSGCDALASIIIRKTSVVTLANINAFYGSSMPFNAKGTGGTLYVPSALISSYQSATNWSTILGYANNSIQAIEGSQYENYYADGTPIE